MKSAVVAVLFVQPRGIYSKLAEELNLDIWPKERDARGYVGPHPVVSHAECGPWGRYAKLTPESKALGPMLGDDGGCFEFSLSTVRRVGGVIEHPKDSKAWRHFGLTPPPVTGWAPASATLWTCRVEQGHYGHAAQKPTWLLYSSPRGIRPFDLIWGPSEVAPRPWAKARGVLECLSKNQRAATPEPFARVLVQLALHAVQSK